MSPTPNTPQAPAVSSKEWLLLSPAAVGKLVPVLCTVDVAFWSGSPEDGAHAFLPPLGICTDSPGQGTSGEEEGVKAKGLSGVS